MIASNRLSVSWHPGDRTFCVCLMPRIITDHGLIAGQRGGAGQPLQVVPFPTQRVLAKVPDSSVITHAFPPNEPLVATHSRNYRGPFRAGYHGIRIQRHESLYLRLAGSPTNRLPTRWMQWIRKFNALSDRNAVTAHDFDMCVGYRTDRSRQRHETPRTVSQRRPPTATMPT